MFIFCLNCQNELIGCEDLFFYEEKSGGKHLEVKNEKNKGLTYVLKENDKKVAMAPMKLHCSCCQSKVGSMLKRDHGAFDYSYCLDSESCSYGPSIQELLKRPSKKEKWGPFYKLVKETPSLAKVLIIYTESTIRNINGASTLAPLSTTKNQSFAPTVFGSGDLPVIPELRNDHQPRDSQIEAYSRAMSRNTILVMPTGTGKTLCSILLLAGMHRLNKRPNSAKRVGLFIVHRIPLVSQQAESIRKYTDLKVETLFGEINDGSKKDKIVAKDYDILVATIKTVLILIDQDRITVKDFHTVVFDEAHNASGGHPYTLLVDKILQCPPMYQPRVLGLSASVTDDDTMEKAANSIQKLESLMRCQVYVPPSLLKDGIGFDLFKECSPLRYNLTQQEVILINLLDTHINNIVEKVMSQVSFTDADVTCKVKNSQKFFYGLRKLERYLIDSKNDLLLEYCKYLFRLCKIFSVISVQGIQLCLQLLHSDDDNISHACRDLNSLHQAFMIDIQNSVSQSNVHHDLSNKLIYSSKYSTMINEIKSVIRDLRDNKESFRGIIFVDTRACADEIVKTIRKEEFQELLQTKLFVGHKGDGGMSAEKQQLVMRKFKAGQCRLLIATNVLEEGIDVQECNIIISYDRVKTLKSFIQRRGRARSKVNSRFLLLLTDAEHVHTLDLIRKEQIMNRAIASLMNQREEDENLEKLMANWKVFKEKKASVTVKDNLSLSRVFISIYNTSLDKSELSDIFRDLDLQVEDLELVYDNSRETRDYLSKFYVVSFLVVDKKEVLDTLKNHFKELDTQAWVKYTWQLLEFNSPTSNNNRTRSLQEPEECVLESFDFGIMNDPVTYANINRLFGKSHVDINNRYLSIRCDWLNLLVLFEDLESFILIDGNTLYLPCKRPAKLFTAPPNDERCHIKVYSTFQYFGLASVYKLSFTSESNIAPLINILIRNQFSLYHVSLTEIGFNQSEIEFHLPDVELDYYLSCLKASRYSRFGFPEIPRSFIESLVKDHSENRERLKQIFVELQKSKTPFENLDKLYQTIQIDLTDPPTPQVPDHGFKLVKKVYITPSGRVIYQIPQLVQSNIVIRTFDINRFLVVEFVEENQKPFKSLGPLLAEYFKEFMHSIELSPGQVYRFLGSSSSQARRSKCWFYNESGTDQTIDYIRNVWAGLRPYETQFRKYNRCMALLFSGSNPSVSIRPDQFHIIDDVIINDRNFTEGCGYIGVQTAKRLIDTLDLPVNTSSFQVRIAGCKGTLVINHEVPEGVYCRKSMQKFSPSLEQHPEHLTLGIVSVSGVTHYATLNRQLINLLSGLGVPDHVFLDLQHKSLAKLSRILYDPTISRPLINQFFPQVSESDILTDPFLKRILISFYRNKFNLIKNKAKIEVEQSRYLLGVIAPESKRSLLKENQVFIQITQMNQDGSGTNRVLQGPVIVAKPPCLFPGDIRVLEAVDIKELHNTSFNEIIFSYASKIPNFAETSGSDLDGDRFFVCYDPEIVRYVKMEPSYFSNEESLIPPSAIELSKSTEDQFFSTLANAQLGVIANAHLVISDRESIFSTDAILLAKEHSKAVDYVKTGVNGAIPKPIYSKLVEYGIPMFMDSDSNRVQKIYDSSNVLGKLFNQCSHLSNISEFIPAIQPDSERYVEGYQSYVQEAKAIYKHYKFEIKSLLRRYGASSEDELISMYFEDQSLARLYTAGIKREIQSHLKALHSKYLGLFLLEFQQKSQGPSINLAQEFGEEIQRKLSAWYCVCYSDPDLFKAPSFYWILSEYQQPKERTTRDTSNTLSKSIFNLIESKRLELYHSYSMRVQVIQSIEELLKASGIEQFEGCSLKMYGSSSMMIFSPEESDLDLYLSLNTDHTDENQILGMIKSILLTADMDIRSVRHIDNAMVPIVKFELCNISIDISIHSDGIKKTNAILYYLEHYPILYPFLSTILEWGKKSTLSSKKHQRHVILTNWSLIWLSIEFLIKKHLIEEDQGLNLRPIQYYKPVAWWETYFKSVDIQKQPTVGDLVLEFFNYYSKEFAGYLWRSQVYQLISPLDTVKHSLDISEPTVLSYIYETLMISFHLLSTVYDIYEFLIKISIEKSKIVKLLSYEFNSIDEPIQFFKRIEEVSGSKIEIKVASKREKRAVYIHITGNQQEIRAAHNEIQKYLNMLTIIPKSTHRLNIKGGSTHLLVQGSRSLLDQIKFSVYSSPHYNSRHQLKTKYDLELNNGLKSDNLDDSKLTLSNLFSQQLEFYLRSKHLNYGQCQAFIRVGHIYAINVGSTSKIFTINYLRKSMKKTQKGYNPEDQDDLYKRLVGKVERASNNPEKQKAKESIKELESRAKKEKKENQFEKLPKTTFFSQSKPIKELIQPLLDEGFKIIEKREDYFTVTAKIYNRSKASEFKFHLDHQLNTISVKQSVHWAVADLKTNYQYDLRFNVKSSQTLDPNDIDQWRNNILLPNPNSKIPFQVKNELIENVSHIRHIKNLMVLQRDSPDSFNSKLTIYQVDQYNSKGGLISQHSELECSLDIPSNSYQIPSFIHTLWSNGILIHSLLNLK